MKPIKWFATPGISSLVKTGDGPQNLRFDGASDGPPSANARHPNSRQMSSVRDDKRKMARRHSGRLAKDGVASEEGRDSRRKAPWCSSGRSPASPMRVERDVRPSEPSGVKRTRVFLFRTSGIK